MSTAGCEDDLSAELIRRARGGEEVALGELIETWRTYLLHVANEELDQGLKAKLGASDVVQSACFDIYEHFRDFQGETIAEWKAWLHQLLLRDLQDARRRYRETGRRDVRRERRLSDSIGFQIDPEDENLSPRAAVIAQEEAAVLRAALRRLSHPHRRAIRLRNWEGLSFAEIGQKLGRSEEAARKLWTRAVEKLEAALKRIADDS